MVADTSSQETITTTTSPSMDDVHGIPSVLAVVANGDSTVVHDGKEVSSRLVDETTTKLDKGDSVKSTIISNFASKRTTPGGYETPNSSSQWIRRRNHSSTIRGRTQERPNNTSNKNSHNGTRSDASCTKRINDTPTTPCLATPEKKFGLTRLKSTVASNDSTPNSQGTLTPSPQKNMKTTTRTTTTATEERFSSNPTAVSSVWDSPEDQRVRSKKRPWFQQNTANKQGRGRRRNLQQQSITSFSTSST